MNDFKHPFILASTPRTGSFLLMDLLRSTNKCAATVVFKWMCKQMNVSVDNGGDIKDRVLMSVVEKIYDRSNARYKYDGTWGIKFYSYQIAIVERLWELYGRQPLKWIFLRRKDKIDQALSRWRWQITGVGHLNEHIQSEEEIRKVRSVEILPSSDNIIRLLCGVINYYAEEMKWQDFFCKQGITPLEVFYEDFREEANRQKTVAEILDYLGADYDMRLKLYSTNIVTAPDKVPSIKEEVSNIIANWQTF